MLIITRFHKSPSVERLLHLWEQRYKPDFSSLSLADPLSYGDLVAAASPKGRALTAAKLKDNLIDINCQMAGIQAQSLYAYVSNILDLKEARRITKFTFHVYKKLLDIYQQQSPTEVISTSRVTVLAGNTEENTLTLWGIPAVEELAAALEPDLLELQEQHVASKDWRTLGFITTQLNFGNKLIQGKLNPIEKALLSPYLKFVEEQVALPWQRVCAAAVKHELDSPAFELVEQLLPQAQDIAQVVYQRLVEMFPDHHSRRGGLTDPGVTHSCLRDLNMFQAYFCLCVLEESLEPVEKELVTLCVMVMPSVDVKWEMTEIWTQVLTDEMLSRLSPQQQEMLLPYTQGMQKVFYERRQSFGFNEEAVINAV